MNRALTAFLTIAVMTGLLAALSFAIRLKGYAFGATGIERLDGVANAATFMPLAALYAFAAALMVLLPVRAAGFVYTNAASPIWQASLALLATILGLQVARFGFGDRDAPWVLIDWRFLFAFGVIGAHLFIDVFRRNVLLRTIGLVLFIGIMLACLYWTFRF